MTTLRSHVPLLVFGGFLLSVYGAAIFIISPVLATMPQPDILAAALTMDLAVLVPLVYYLVLVRRKGWPAFSVAPIFLLSLGAVSWLVPAEHQSLLQALEWLVAPVELFVLGYIGVKVVRMTRHFRAQGEATDVYDRLREGFRQALGVRWAADVFAFEVGLFYYALFTWRTPVEAEQDRFAFSYHRRSGYGPVVTAILVAMGIELIALHVLLHLWSPAAAWVMTALSGYGIVWIVGDWQAVRHRPVRIEDDALLLRIGLRWTVRVPFSQIEAVYPARSKPPARKTPGYLEAILLGKPTYLVVCKEPVVAQGLYGIRKRVTTIGFALDDTPAFEAALQARYAAWRAQQA